MATILPDLDAIRKRFGLSERDLFFSHTSRCICLTYESLMFLFGGTQPKEVDGPLAIEGSLAIDVTPGGEYQQHKKEGGK